MQQTNREGESKLLSECSLPLTGKKCISKIVTNLGVYEIDHENGGFILLERAPGVSIEDIRKATSGRLIVKRDIPEIKC
jgi:acyl CoA:acetate/3-ketoacid CoA transferase beta subunit